MTIILILLMLITLYKCKFIKNGINEEYITIETTKKINGIFVIFVFLSHSIQYINYSNSWIDNFGEFIVVNIGQLMVTTFLFFSGYGIYESIKSKKESYIDTIPKKRILSTLIKFDIAVLIFGIVSYIFNIKYDIKTILLSFVGWESLGNSNWYIFAILALYTITYLTFKLFKVKDITKISLITLFTILYMLIISKLKGEWWYNTVLCYPLGMLFSLYKEKIEEIFKKSSKNYYISLIILTIVLGISLKYRENIYLYSTIFVTSFVACIVLFSMKVRIHSKFLKFMGDNVFYIYIYQRLPMMILNRYNIYLGNRYIFLIISFGLTVVLTLLINKITQNKKEKWKEERKK